MKWVILAIVLGLAGYTYLTLRYRKPGPAYRPYQDTVNRVTVSRLLSSGYQRIALAVERPADTQRTSVVLGGFASATTARSGLPPELDRALVEKPLLAETITAVTAAAEISAVQPYRIQFSATLADHKRVISEAHLFRKKDSLVIVPVFAQIEGGLQARWLETTVLLTVPGTALPPGHYTATLIGAKGSRTWPLLVR
jgi:hypothetical protein